ncbi:MAG: cnrH 2 [Planctomycetaceae bacterium]|nr:cnrH 2 [Planctomycetaceae bacterium]
MELQDRQELFVRLFARYERELRRYALTLLADSVAVDDVIQESSVALWRKFDDYRVEDPFLAWACKFIYFEALKYRKKWQSQRRFFSPETFEALAREAEPVAEQQESERLALRDCLSLLPVADRELVGLRYATETTIASLAKETGQTAKSLYRALERIRRVLALCVQKKLAAGGNLSWEAGT